MKSRGQVRWVLPVLLLAAIGGSLWWSGYQGLRGYAGDEQATFEAFGPWAMVFFGAAYASACVLLVPGSVLTMMAGAMFGVVWGTIVASISSTIGATAALLAGRYVARDWVEARVSTNRGFQAVDRTVDNQGFKIVMLMRLSPVFPFNFLNYAFGLTRVSLRDFVLGSWIGILPATLMYVYLGTACVNLAGLAAGELEGGVLAQALFGVSVLVTVWVTFSVTRMARRVLADAKVTELASDMEASHA